MTREEAIKILKSKMDGSVDTSYEWAEAVRMAIEALSSEPKTGKWIEVENGEYLCSNCLRITIGYPPNYCPYCRSFNGDDEE